MRFVDGTDLRELLAPRGPARARRAARIVGQIAAALDAAHARGLVHRDVKPANVLIAGPGRARLPDRLRPDQAAQPQQRPDQARGSSSARWTTSRPSSSRATRVDARADVYALGCVLYQALTGQVPFPRETEPAKMFAHVQRAAAAARQARAALPPELDDVLERAMAKAPDDRYLSAGDLGRAAVAAAQGHAMSRSERSVATGDAAPAGAAAVPGAAPAAAATALGAASPGATVLGEQPGATSPPAVPPTGPAAPPGGWAPPGAPPPATASTAGKRRLPLILAIAGGVLALIVVVAIVALATGGSGGSDAAGTIVGKPIPVGKQPYDVEVGGGFVWTANLSADTISKIDPKKGTAQQIKVGGVPVELAVDGGAVWV